MFPHLYIYNDPMDIIINRYKGKLNTHVLTPRNQEDFKQCILTIEREHKLSQNAQNVNIVIITYESIFNNEIYGKHNVDLLNNIKNYVKEIVVCGNEPSTDFLSSNSPFMSLFKV
jgi:hypothetical protein